jgi:hypothetical protein
MKHRLLAAATASVLALALLPGGAWAAMPGGLDQNVPPAGTPVMAAFSAGDAVTQTFTAGVTGALTHVELYCEGASGPAGVDIYFGTFHEASGTCPGTAGWVDLNFKASQLMAAGSTSTIRIVASDDLSLGVAGAGYSGGAAGDAVGDPITGLDDFAFRTYVLPLQTISSTWDPATVQPGVSTPATLTSVISFPAISLNPLVADIGYQVQLWGLPSWFTPDGSLSCTGVGGISCDLATLETPPGIVWFGDDGAAVTLTLGIPGTAAPGAEDWSDSAQLYACVFANSDGVETFPPPGTSDVNVGQCNSAYAELTVGGATPPPTATSGSSGSSGGGLPLWYLPAGVTALLGMILATRRQLGRVR